MAMWISQYVCPVFPWSRHTGVSYGHVDKSECMPCFATVYTHGRV
ncbi:putative oligo-1,6-glucosidase 2 [Gossypium arboreum]|uniref:Putative oligo-1,6-glucosidase 2 n=1 Tax=Gossypium arboreum TaxID=29729 RepID=A0A0B0N6G1_GOSAR|nr:putative oligo-1,6-glucosidase 2 [Gossypium arboreum]